MKLPFVELSVVRVCVELLVLSVAVPPLFAPTVPALAALLSVFVVVSVLVDVFVELSAALPPLFAPTAPAVTVPPGSVLWAASGVPKAIARTPVEIMRAERIRFLLLGRPGRGRQRRRRLTARSSSD